MKHEIEQLEQHTLLRIQEPHLDFSAGPALRKIVQKLTNSGHNRLVLDLSDVSSADSSGLSAFVAAHSICQSFDGYLILTGICSQIEKIIGLARLEGLLLTAASVEDAVAGRIQEVAAADRPGTHHSLLP